MENDGGQLCEEDMGFIYEKEDLVTLRPGREHAWLDGLLERTLKVLRCRLVKVGILRTKSTRQVLISHHSSSSAPRSVISLHYVGRQLTATRRQETREKNDDDNIHYYDRNRISSCVTMIITTIVLALLVVPIWLLYKFSVEGTIATSPDTVAVVLVFTLVFSAAITGFTKARRHEIVAASAG